MSGVRVGVIGDFDPESPTHRATSEALGHSGAKLGAGVDVSWLPTETLERGVEAKLSRFDGLWCAPGSPYVSLEGAVEAVRFARENDRPFIGTCGGFQHVILEYARNVLGFDDAAHAEYDPYASMLFITPLSCSLAGKTMRVQIKAGSRTSGLYAKEEIKEQFYCNFGLDPARTETLFSGELNVSGHDEDGEVRVIELEGHRFYLATLFVPQTSSTAEEPHPLVSGFVEAARKFKDERTDFEKRKPNKLKS